ncbi:hypothetical protein J7K74_01690, partial [Candidatus Woesearchaeota archaeon]|nr:hypothetical protein [Candidatus Woesearchaeota archaeon]
MQVYTLKIEEINIISIPTQNGVKTIDKIVATLKTPKGTYCIHQKVLKTRLNDIIDLVGKEIEIDSSCVSREYDPVDGQEYIVLNQRFYKE